MGSFTLGGREGMRCPCCKESVVAVTCAFSDCAWMFDGCKTDGTQVTSPWRTAGDKYERFEEANNMTSWDRLVLTTRPNAEASAPPHPQECTICFEAMYQTTRDEVKRTRCGHEFHADCLAKWVVHQRTCPVCRGDLPAGVSASAVRMTGTVRTFMTELSQRMSSS